MAISAGLWIFYRSILNMKHHYTHFLRTCTYSNASNETHVVCIQLSLTTPKTTNYHGLPTTTDPCSNCPRINFDIFLLVWKMNAVCTASLTFHGSNSRIISWVAFKFSTVPRDYWVFALCLSSRIKVNTALLRRL
jgi:hypothetical protein